VVPNRRGVEAAVSASETSGNPLHSRIPSTGHGAKDAAANFGIVRLPFTMVYCGLLPV